MRMVLSTVGAVFLTACAAATAPPPSSAQCPGIRVANVTNASRESLEISVSSTAEASGRFLGNVGPNNGGSFELPAGAQTVRIGVILDDTGRRGRTPRGVRVAYSCR